MARHKRIRMRMRRARWPRATSRRQFSVGREGGGGAAARRACVDARRRRYPPAPTGTHRHRHRHRHPPAPPPAPAHVAKQRAGPGCTARCTRRIRIRREAGGRGGAGGRPGPGAAPWRGPLLLNCARAPPPPFAWRTSTLDAKKRERRAN